ncbi:MAG TPA: PilZ domain-containing protein [Rhodocyclaceae bacterium]|nr:PilZ domain-containing protein [Rhodocyclaceae bacterium]
MSLDASALDDDIPGVLGAAEPVSPEELVPQAEAAPPPEAQRRADPRFRVRWKAGVVNGEGAARKIIVMRTVDISLGGMAVLCHDKVPPAEQHTVLVVMPPLMSGTKEVIVEIRAKIVYSVLDTSKDCFRLGVRFLEFKKDGLKLLKDRLTKHHVPAGNS